MFFVIKIESNKNLKPNNEDFKIKILQSAPKRTAAMMTSQLGLTGFSLLIEFSRQKSSTNEKKK